MPYRQDLDTGEWIEVDAQGNPIEPARGSVIALPPDPVEQARLGIAQSQESRAQDQAGLREELLRAQIRKAEADAAKAEQGTAGAATGDAKLQARLANVNALVDQINRVQELYKAGPGATSGIKGVADLFPTPANKQFDAAAAGLAEQGLAAFRVPGVGAQSDTELRQFVQANKPEASNFDAEIEEKLRQLRNRVDKTRESMGLGPAEWVNIQRPNALTIPRVVPGQPLEAAGAGATTAGQPVDPDYQAEYTAWVTQNGGRFTPEQYAAFRSGLDQKYGYGATVDYVTEGQRIADSFARGGSQNLTIPPTEEPLSEGAFGGQARNNAVSNPIGAAAAGFADMAGFGGVSALAPTQMAALGDAQPVASTLGQMGGAVLGTGILSSALRNTAGRAAPRLLQGGNRAALARDVATDAAYSGIYGANTGQDPLDSAGWGAAGSLGGRAVGAGLGKTVSGANVSAAVDALKARGIPMTVPQQLGGFAKSVEDKATSIPLIGDMIRNRRTEGLEAFNREAFNEAGVPIRATVRDIGEEGVQQLTDQIGSAYDQATAGVTVPFDGQFLTDFAQAAQRGQALPPDLRRRLGQVLDARVAPITDTGQMTGEQFQQAIRALKQTRNKPPQQFGGFEQDYRDAVTGAMDALEGQITRGAPQVVPALSAANAANRNKGALASAVRTAAGGSQSGEAFMFTPNQLQRAGLATEAKFPGPRPFADLADAGQRILPSQVPDSGTAGRAAQMAMPAALGGTGAGLGFMASGDAQGAQTGATYGALATALALLGGTKVGQKALQKTLIDRSPRAVAIGNAVRNKRGLFGSASLPLLIAN